jgi:hypothetical protein
VLDNFHRLRLWLFRILQPHHVDQAIDDLPPVLLLHMRHLRGQDRVIERRRFKLWQLLGQRGELPGRKLEEPRGVYAVVVDEAGERFPRGVLDSIARRVFRLPAAGSPAP